MKIILIRNKRVFYVNFILNSRLKSLHIIDKSYFMFDRPS